MKNRIVIFYSWLSILILILNGCSVKVERINIEKIPILSVGDTYKLLYSIEPGTATDKTVCFETNNNDIATIDSQGLITALSPGEVEISVSPSDKKRTSTNSTKISVTVIQPIDSITCKHELTVAVGKNESIDAQALPENASEKELTYKSSDEDVVTVDDKGVIKGIKKGTAVIVINSVNGIEEECKITVKQPVKGIDLSKTNIELTVGGNATLKATLIPKDADLNIDVTFSSSDKSVITIDANGKINAVSKGSATITAFVKDLEGNLIDSKCKIQVTPKKTVSSNSSSSRTQIVIPPLQNTRCMPCMGTGYMMSGVVCYFCDGTGKEN